MADTASSRTPLSPNNFARLVLVLVGVVWLAVGVAALADPTGTADWVDFDLESSSALAEFRAMYGGLSVALALLHIGSAVRGAWLRPALLMSSALTAGLLTGRLVSIGLDGVPGPFVLGLALSEVLLLGLSGVALWRLWRQPGAATAPAPPAVSAAPPSAEPATSTVEEPVAPAE